MAFNKTDINTENEAKEYPNYYGGVLKPEEKAIFDNGLLKPNGILNKTFLQDTAELLNNLKQSKEKVKTATMGLDDDKRTLLKSFLVEQKGETIPYQLVNSLGSDKPVDKVISQLEDVFFAENEPEFDRKIETTALKLKELLDKGKGVDEEIEKLQKKYNQKLLEEQTTLEGKVSAAVTALKNELKTAGGAGLKILQNIIDSNKDYSERFYTPTVPDSATSYGSVIQTGYISSAKPYAHPAYLLEDLPGQI
ncbi:17159_t:CDS:1 [Funneliformis geosporum]|nr:17159_t:CDS:1 [Funneliformis geosporum]